VSRTGFEPVTKSLKGSCSTAELPARELEDRWSMMEGSIGELRIEDRDSTFYFRLSTTTFYCLFSTFQLYQPRIVLTSKHDGEILSDNLVKNPINIRYS
jgi:hypothetical protein